MLQSLKYYILCKHFTNTTTATKTQQLAVYIIVCNTNLRKCSLFVNNPKIRTIKCRTETSTQFNKHMFATFVRHSKEPV